MKKLGILITLSIGAIAYAALVLPPNQPRGPATPLATKQTGYIQINSVTADDTALASTTKFWDNIDGNLAAEVQFVPIPSTWNRVELSFYGYGDGVGDGSPDGATFTFTVLAARPGSGVKNVFTGAGTIGAQQMSADPVAPASKFNSGAVDSDYTWCDTIAASGNGDEWADPVILSGEGGNDGIATVSFDFDGYWGLFVEITDMTAQSVTSVTCIATGW